MNKRIHFFIILLSVSFTYAQVGINTNDPKATLDVIVETQNINKPFGIIAPRITGVQLNNSNDLFGSDQNGTIVFVTSSAETTTGKSKNVTERGYYYFDSTLDNGSGSNTGLWVALKNSPINYVEPWYNVLDKTPATTNTQNIYQMGSISVGKSSVYESTNKVMLDVVGAIRTGTDRKGSVGVNSVAMGSSNIASGIEAVSLGRNTVASGEQSTAIGNLNTASGNGSFAGGYWDSASNLGSTASAISSFAFGNGGVEANGSHSFAFGYNSKTSSTSAYSLAFGNTAQTFFNHSIAIGVGTEAPTRSSIALGRYNKYTSKNITGSNTNNTIGDPIFQVGQGSDNGTRANIITGYYGMNTDGSFRNGWVVIGANPSNAESKRLGTELLTVYGGITSTSSINAGGSVNQNVSTYPDYVFQNYYTGESILNNNYNFIDLYQTEKFIKENNHLPGVTPISELNKTATGYSINVGLTATQALEKVEELYIHTIEQQKQIDLLIKMTETLKSEIKSLKEN